VDHTSYGDSQKVDAIYRLTVSCRLLPAGLEWNGGAYLDKLRDCQLPRDTIVRN